MFMVHGSLFIAFLLHSISLLIISCFVLRGWVSRQAKYGSHPAKKILVRPPRGAVARRPSAICQPISNLQLQFKSSRHRRRSSVIFHPPLRIRLRLRLRPSIVLHVHLPTSFLASVSLVLCLIACMRSIE